MPFLPRLASLWRNILHKDRVEQELNQEVLAYLELLTDMKIAEGLKPEEARRAALIELGGVEQVKEQVREVSIGQKLERMFHDLRYGARMLLKQPGFTLTAVLTLGLGIGANTAIFSIVHAVLLRPFPYHAPDRLVFLEEKYDAGGFSPSHPNVVDWRAQSTLFESIVAVRQNESFNLTGAGEPERLQGRLVSAEFLSMLGVEPMLGRDLFADDDRPGATPAVILSYGFWRRRFGEDRSVIGRELTLNKQSFTVVGITPADFHFGAEADVTVPIGLSAERFRLRGSDPGVDVAARLKPNVSVQQAESELNTIAARLEEQYPQSNKGRRVLVTPLHEGFVGDVRRPLLILLGAVGLVLLIACANVANLLLLRSSARRKEMSVRVALGATRRTIVRQLLTESVLLATFGAALGILLALWGTSFIAANLPEGIPRLQEARIDTTVLFFTLAVSILTGLLFGLAPALQASRPNLVEGLKEGDRGASGRRQRLRSLLVVGEIAMTLTLLVSAGLLIQSFRRVLQVDPGFKAENLLTMQVSVNNPDGQQVANFFDELQQRVRNLPGVKFVAVSNGLPFGGANHPGFIVEGRAIEDSKGSGIRYTVSPDYFRTMGIELISGRVFTAEDTRNSQRVIVVDEALVRKHFLSEEPIGKRIRQSPASPGLEIVGVVRHVEPYSLGGQAPVSQFYTNFNQTPLETLPNSVRRINLLTRTNGDPMSLAPAVRGEIAGLNKDQAVFNIRSMEQILSESVAPRRFSMLLLTIFAVVAMVLASIGIYGMMSYAVAQHTREIGVRMALGAKYGSVLRMVIGQGMKLALAGVAIGLIASLALTRTIKSLLFNVSATDPATFALIALLLTLVALFACWIPARRATRVDPVIALRCD